MLEKGWKLKIRNFNESNDEFEERLLGYRYNSIKLYQTTTSIRGYYDTIAMVKR